jgi:hypothetical protein
VKDFGFRTVVAVDDFASGQYAVHIEEQQFDGLQRIVRLRWHTFPFGR